MKILVTGGAGFIGSNLCRRLVEGFPHADVSVADNFVTGFRKNLDRLDLELFEGNLEDPDFVRDCVRGKDVVVHLGALGSVPRSIENPYATFLSNVLGTQNVMEASRNGGVRRVIFASSSSVYGGNQNEVKQEDDVLIPLSPYAASKISGEAIVQGHASAFGIEAYIFRFFNVFGPLQNPSGPYAAVIPRFIQAALRNEPLKIFGDGSQTRDFTFVEDLVRVLSRAIFEPKRSGFVVSNLAFGGSVHVLDLAKLIIASLGSRSEIVFLQNRPGDPKVSSANTKRFLALFDEISPVGFEAGLEETIKWFQSL